MTLSPTIEAALAAASQDTLTRVDRETWIAAGPKGRLFPHDFILACRRDGLLKLDLFRRRARLTAEGRAVLEAAGDAQLTVAHETSLTPWKAPT